MHPFDAVDWELRDARIGQGDSVAFEQRDVEFPVTWSQNATNIVAQKYFRGQLDSPARERSVKRLADEGGALDAALELAAQIVKNGPLALDASKQIVQNALDWTEAEAWEKQGAIAGPVMVSEDAREGAIAFAEKRDPVWKGK